MLGDLCILWYIQGFKYTIPKAFLFTVLWHLIHAHCVHNFIFRVNSHSTNSSLYSVHHLCFNSQNFHFIMFSRPVVLTVWICDVNMISYMDYWKHQRHIPLYRIFLILMLPVTQWKHLEAIHVICVEFGRVWIWSELYSNSFYLRSKKPFLCMQHKYNAEFSMIYWKIPVCLISPTLN